METEGYFKDVYINKKYIGSIVCDKDRDIFGFYGRLIETTINELVLSNKKRIKPNTLITTELQIICKKK